VLQVENNAKSSIRPTDPRVSILISTYNHQKYINQCIDSILMQDVIFAYEIVIGDDGSSDGTRETVLSLRERFPDRIRVLLTDKSDSERDRANGLGGKTNFTNALKACRGQYVAWLDSDDYWTNPSKLQKQVDFLDAHPECAICFHDVELVYDDGSRKLWSEQHRNQKARSGIEDLLADNFMQSCSVMFRNRLIGELPDWFYTSKVGDWPLHIMNAQHGKIGYLTDVMAAYRIHSQGFWSAQKASYQLVDGIELLDNLNRYLGFAHNKKIKETQTRYYANLAEIHYSNNDFVQAKSFLGQSVKLSLANGRLPPLQLVGRFLKLQLLSLRGFVK
jgi:glycosyltransferase involved in cell wall biosynthesis